MRKGAGCFKNFFAGIGCITLLVALAIVGWHYRAQVGGLYRSVAGGGGRGDGGVPTVGVPSRAALRSAEQKEAAMARRGGPGYVRLSADEIAALIEHRLDPAARRALDSIRVLLTENRLALEGEMLLDVFTPELLGPLAELLGSRQPLWVAGTVAMHEPGLVAWRVDEFVIREFPFPASAIPRLVNRLTGRSEGAFMIPVPSTVGEVHVDADGVTFYRRTE
ncbi:MAG: hypothetical protein PVF27_01745 [Gemmatimonadales bacterium]